MSDASKHMITTAPDESFEEVRDALLELPKAREGYEERDAIMLMAEQIRAMRIQRNMTQSDLAGLMKTSQPEIVRLESGSGRRGPTVSMLKRVAQALREEMFVGFHEQGRGTVPLDQALVLAVKALNRPSASLEERDAAQAIDSVQWLKTL